MKLTSLESILESAKSTITRFPLQVLAVLGAMFACCYLIHLDGQPFPLDQYWKLALICNIAFVALLSADLYAEANQWKILKKWGLRLLVLAFAVLLYFSLFPQLFSTDWFTIGFFILVFHLTVSFSAFLHSGTLSGFWEFNRILLLRILTAAFYAAVLFAGLAIAMVAVDQLFKVTIDAKVYFYLLTLTGIGFTAFYFMAGVPRAFHTLSTAEPLYPKELKVFTQYVLIPLMLVYLAILLVYEVTIIISWELPKGTVSVLVLSYAVAALLSVLLIYPIRDKIENHWFRKFSKFIFIMMIPLLVLLMLAIWERVRHYGITEPRYMLIVLAIWLSIITVYFLASAQQNIRIIPISLSVMALLSTFGPQSATSVSRYSQLQRFERYRQAKDHQGKVEKRHLIKYLVSYHGLGVLQPYITADLQAAEQLIKTDSLNAASRYVMEAKLIDTAYQLFKVDDPKLERQGRPSQLIFATDKQSPLSVKGYDYLISINNTLPIDLVLRGEPVAIRQPQKGALSVKIGKQAAISFAVRTIVQQTELAYRQGKLKAKDEEDYYLVPEYGMSSTLDAGPYSLQLVLTDVVLYRQSTNKDDYSFRGYLLLKIK
jgi:hypothetical protein